MLLHNYIDPQGYTAALMKDNLSNISDSEIQSIKKRINFYVNHFKMSKNRQQSESKEKQLEFLEVVDNLIETEINNRSLCYSYR